MELQEDNPSESEDKQTYLSSDAHASMVERVEGQGRRVLGRVLSIILRSAYAIGVLIYVAFYTSQFTPFQKAVVLLVALIIFGAAESIVRISRHGRGGWWL